MSAVDVSVIIPTYNRLWSLPAAVASCLGTRCRAEVIVVDDGSTDGTWEWLAREGAAPNLVALRQPNRGKGWAVGRGLASARGAYVRFLDSDDALMPGAIDAQLEVARRTDADLVAAGFETVDERGAVLSLTEYVPTDDFLAQQLGESDGSHYSAFLFKREFVADIPHRPEYGALDDRMYILEVAMRRPRVAVSPGPALRHTHHAAERLQFQPGMRSVVTHYQMLQVYRTVLAELTARGELDARRRRAAARILWRLAHWIGYTHPHEGAEVADWVRRLDPAFRGPERGLLGVLYRAFGFRATETILRGRRALLTPLRRRVRPRPQRFPV